MGRGDQREDEGRQGDEAVGAAGLPGVLEGLGGDEAGHRQQDDHRQGRLGQVIEEGRQEEQDDSDEEAVEDHGEAGLGPGLEVDGRAGEGAAGGVGLEEGAADVGQALADELLIGVQALLGLGRQGLGHGDGLHEGHQGDDQGGGEELDHHVQAQGRDAEGRQAGGDLADHVAAADQLHLPLLDLLDVPAAFTHRHALQHGVRQIDWGGLILGDLAADELELADLTQPLLILDLQGGDIDPRQDDVVLEVGGGALFLDLLQFPQIGGLGGHLRQQVLEALVGLGITGHQFPRRRVDDLVQFDLGLVLVLQQGAGTDGHQHRDEDAQLG